MSQPTSETGSDAHKDMPPSPLLAQGGGVANSAPPVVTSSAHARRSYTIETTPEILKEALPPGLWIRAMAAVCNGQAVGDAIRYTGDDLVYVRFTLATGRYLAFSCPKRFLIPRAAAPLARGNSFIGGSSFSPLLSASMPRPAFGQSLGTLHDARLKLKKGDVAFEVNAHDAHDDVVVQSSAEPLMCVVCGQWAPGGEKRKSGVKCPGCVGKASTKRLRDIYKELLETSASQASFGDGSASASGDDNVET